MAELILAICGPDVRAYRSDGTPIPIARDGTSDSARPTLIRWYPHGRLLAVAFTSGTIVFHHYEDLRIIGSINASNPDKRLHESSSILCFDVTCGSRFLAAGTKLGELNIWDLKKNKILNNFHLNSPVSAVAFQQTSDSRYVACATGSDVFLYSRASNRLVDTFTVAPLPKSSSDVLPISGVPKVTSMAFSPHAVSLLAVADDSGNLNVWDISRTHASRGSISGAAISTKIGTNSCYSRFPSELNTSCTDLIFTSTASTVGLLVGGLDKTIRVFDKLLKRSLLTIECALPVTSVACSWDNTYVSAGHSNGQVSIFKVDFANKSSSLDVTIPPKKFAHTSHSTAITSLQFQPKLSESADMKPQSTVKKTPMQQPGLRGSQRAMTSPVISQSTNVQIPERSADDSVQRPKQFPAEPSDSDLFSPLIRPPPSNNNPSEKSIYSSGSVVRKLDDDYGPEENGAIGGSNALDFLSSSSAVPEVRDRRMSDIIPMATTKSIPAIPEPKDDEFHTPVSWKKKELSVDSIDADAIDSMLSPPKGKTTEETPMSTPISTSAAVNGGNNSIESDFVGASSDTATSAKAVEKAKNRLPRGAAFSRIPKSQTLRTPRNLPPRPPPRASTNPKSLGGDETPNNMNGNGMDDFGDGNGNHTGRTGAGAGGTNAPKSMTISTPTAHTNSNSNSRGVPMSPTRIPSSPSKAHNIAIPMSPSKIQPLERRQPLTASKESTSLVDLVRTTIVGEIDAVRQDLRSDVLNIHTQLILSSARQTQEIEEMFIERDNIIEELRKKVEEVCKENARLRGELYEDI